MNAVAADVKGVVSLTEMNFGREVIQSDQPVLVDFWASWCQPCKMISPIVEEIAREYEGLVRVFKVNVDENSSLASTFSIRSIPALLLFQDGYVVSQLIGTRLKAEITAEIDRLL